MSQVDRRGFLATLAGAGVAAAAQARPQAQDARLRALLDRMFEAQVDRSPQEATTLGLDIGDRRPLKSRLDDRSSAARDQQLVQAQAWLDKLQAIDRTKLSEASKIDLDVVTHQQRETAKNGARWAFGDTAGNFKPYVVSQRNGAYQEIPDFLDSAHTVANAGDAEAWLSRLRAFARAMDQDLVRQAHDVDLGVVPTDFVCDLALGQMAALRNPPASRSILATALARKAAAAGAPGDWQARAARIVEDEVFPALDRQVATMAALRSRAKPDMGMWGLPDGEAYYADALKAATTTELTPAEVHAMGLDQVAEISGRLDAILRARGQTQGGVGTRLAALNARPDQSFPDSDAGRGEILSLLNGHVKRMHVLMPGAFRRLPSARIEVRRVPVFIQDGRSNGYYIPASPDGSRPAVFYINLKETADWPRYNLWTLAHHETVPGHHLQIALAQETAEIPLIRRSTISFSAFTEGWALYAEQLSQELGANAFDPLGEAGYLQSLLFRAARLVVDTGIHARRWTRAQATNYLVDTVGNARPRAQREVERYFASPAQATSYKVGHTVHARLRDRAKAELGARFDLKAYHDAVLAHGALPLTLLQTHMAAWIRDRTDPFKVWAP